MISQFYPSRKNWVGSTEPAFLFLTQRVLKELDPEREPRVHVGLAGQLAHAVAIICHLTPCAATPLSLRVAELLFPGHMEAELVS